MTKQSQEKGILDLLLQGKTITPIDALNRFGCFRLGARIYDLRRLGYNIETRLISRGNKQFAEYFLA